MRPSKLGEQESALLTWVASKAPVNTAQVVKGFGGEHDLARTTVTTMLDRLRLKGYLTRKKEGNSFVYAPRDEHQSQLREVVGRFVERTLGGSLDPFVAYLNDAQLNEEQKSQLRALVERLDSEPQDHSAQENADNTEAK
ncbi:BlaI/MecI/CopY family transcriptional regulator [bacterium]|nr:MAG: BlaI/MecI/CopY family transcriptional regulator [bacterium]